MTEGLKNYLFSLVLTGFLTAIIQAILPNGTGKEILSAVCGLLLIFVAIQPVARLDIEDMARSIVKIDIQAAESETGTKIDNQAIITEIIKENCKTYIWDKAKSLGFVPSSISVEVKHDGGYPYPVEVTICGQYEEHTRQRLSAWIESELAVSREHQMWVWN